MAVRVPKGFLLAGVHCRIKSDPRKEDLALVMSQSATAAAGVYTQNLVHSAPVSLMQDIRRLHIRIEIHLLNRIIHIELVCMRSNDSKLVVDHGPDQ